MTSPETIGVSRPIYAAQVTHLKSARLTARPTRESDLLFFQQLWSDPRVMAYLGSPRSPEATRSALEQSTRMWREHGFGRWIVFDAEEPVGTVKLAPVGIHDREEVELGYALAPQFWGRGYAAEAAAAVLGFARETANLDEIVAFALVGNTASIAVMQRLNIRPAGTFERPEEGTFCTDDS
ncbi:MAG: GNAT family N-acetyltransferase [Microlunatus sp.]